MAQSFSGSCMKIGTINSLTRQVAMLSNSSTHGSQHFAIGQASSLYEASRSAQVAKAAAVPPSSPLSSSAAATTSVSKVLDEEEESVTICRKMLSDVDDCQLD